MIYFIVIMIISAIALSAAFAFAMHLGFKAPRISYEDDPSKHQMNFESVKIPTKSGHTLFAWHLLASNKPSAPTIIIMHGWGANREMMLPLAEPFYQSGMNCLLLDARNHGLSPDDGISSLPQFSEDTNAAIDWLKALDPPNNGPLALLGHSVGAGAVLLAASKRDDIDAVISLSSFAHPLWLMQRHLQRPQKSLYLLRFLAPLVMAYTQWMIGHRFEDIAPMNALCSIKCPVLLVHGSSDTVIPLNDMHAIANNCPDKKTEILIIEGAGHESIEKVKQHDKDLLSFLKQCGFK
jgi:uncharacterized protein